MQQPVDSLTKVITYVGSGTLLMANVFFISSLSQPDEMDTFLSFQQPMENSLLVSQTDVVQSPHPSPDLSPDEVVITQLHALQENDEADTGITTAYRFTAPAGRAGVQSLKEFGMLLKSPDYAPLLSCAGYEIRRLVAFNAETAQVIALVTNHQGLQFRYLFSLSRQPEVPYNNCWMTNSILLLELPETLAVLR
jgi:hypothetical protein